MTDGQRSLGERRGGGGGESFWPSRASSRKPESREGPRGQESGREHQSHGKGTGQGRPPPPAGPAPASGSLRQVRPWEQAQATPRRSWRDGGAGDSRSEPPFHRRGPETPEEKSWLRARQLMTCYQPRGLWSGRPGCQGELQPHASTSWPSPVPAHQLPALHQRPSHHPALEHSMAPAAPSLNLSQETEPGHNAAPTFHLPASATLLPTWGTWGCTHRTPSIWGQRPC